jgi:DNA-binding XRE family transcriptional regulator
MQANTKPRRNVYFVTRDRLEGYIKDHSRQEAAVHFGLSLSSLDRKLRKWGLTRRGWGSRKLNSERARQIRRIYSTDKYTQAEIARAFRVRREIVNKIINNKLYPEISMGFGGSAEVKLILHYESSGLRHRPLQEEAALVPPG